MSPISLKFSIAWQDYARAARDLQKSESAVPTGLIVGLVFLTIAVAGYLLGVSLWLVGLAFLGGIVNFCLTGFRALGLRARWRREPMLNAVHEVAFSDDGISYDLGGIHSDLSWNYYQSWIETHQGFLLIYGGDVFNLFPRRAFEA